MAEMKNDQDKTVSNQNKGSGSDTASAAKISAGTSVGNVGESPMPQAQGSQGRMGTSAGSGPSAQSPTYASHTSKPMGGAGPTGAGTRQQGSQGGSAQDQRRQGQYEQGQSGMTETVRHAADQVQEKAGEAYEQAAEWARDTYENAGEWASDTLGHMSERTGRMRGRSLRSMGHARQGVQNYVAQNPVMVGLVGLAAGLLLGALLPRTRREDETFGEWADEVREQGMRYAQEMTQRGRDYVEGSFSGEDERFSRHESEFGAGREGGPSGQGGPGAGPRGQGANRH
jgi:ElaB/YqjD/DUF883 family membrane-anchored ribosome-binding protein